MTISLQISDKENPSDCFAASLGLFPFNIRIWPTGYGFARSPLRRRSLQRVNAEFEERPRASKYMQLKGCIYRRPDYNATRRLRYDIINGSH